MRNVSHYFNTTPFSEHFIQLWDDIDSRLLLLEAYHKGHPDSNESSQLKAQIWNAKILDELATALFGFLFNKRFAKGDSVGTRHNPFIDHRRMLSDEESKRQREKKQYEAIIEWFGPIASGVN